MKQKTHSGAKKRFKLTGSKKNAKVVGRKSNSSHLLTAKSKGQKKMQGKVFHMQHGDSQNIKKMLKV
ncbi:MAG: bL35 family ribosomal protein [Candidatus Peregrinibacteria bacterium]|nr:bL35 family ribosomal protein [Candidatus Peregrinibacteria bacterium]